MQSVKYIFLFCATVLLIGGCLKKEKDFPNQPIIKLKSFKKFGTDSAYCTIIFQDGDGDIGIFPNDTTSPDNLIIKYFYKGADNKYSPYYNPNTRDTLYFNNRLPDITPEGQQKSIEGEIRSRLYPDYFIPGHTKIKFQIKLFDRAGHASNTVTTDEITVP